MEASVDRIESKLASYLSRCGDSVETIQFRRAYLRLVLQFKDELTASQLDGALELQKCLRDEQYDRAVVDELEESSRELLNQHLKNNASTTREALLNQLLFGALLESDDTDVFYVTEPMFLFARKMKVDVNELEEILVSEFGELNA